ncbi:tyrosine-type recombinase/integrase [Xenorhabdus bovienii]|uniref:Putative prophage CPS-53 integrase CPS-53 (KpLE1) prophage n=2 Tax=Xenorhabdus bovienii TaxID=40576 RepID=A0A077Q8K8_XENBV|nr:tyrosine-type recombinase/integrase [Xenorhabdus bovienii]CDH32602.1 putative prophage CPS-53 integrase; CPS-53 (KpLE1) prophage [Xenorhabdus bovienii str. Intermedium]
MLTIKQIESAKSQDKAYRLVDGGGLFLFVSKTGSKIWRFRYRKNGKEQTHVIGTYPEISLVTARLKHAEAKSILANGGDLIPVAPKQKDSEIPDTFAAIYNEWYQFKRAVWSERYAKELQSMFQADILPSIGHMTIKEIEPMVLLKVIRQFEERGAMERASKARRRCGEVFKYAIVTGRAKYNPAPDLAGAMTGYKKKHFPFLTADQIPAFNLALSSYSGSIISRVATQVLQYTALRTNELRSMKWSSIDFDSKLITIEPEIMKNRKIHVVPMSNQVVVLLKTLHPMTSSISNFIFAGRNDKKKPICENAILQVIRQIGYDGIASGHGFRHQFSTILNEHGFSHDLIERQLAHTDRNSIRGIYNHAQYLDKRREMVTYSSRCFSRIMRVNT